MWRPAFRNSVRIIRRIYHNSSSTIRLLWFLRSSILSNILHLHRVATVRILPFKRSTINLIRRRSEHPAAPFTRHHMLHRSPLSRLLALSRPTQLHANSIRIRRITPHNADRLRRALHLTHTKRAVRRRNSTHKRVAISRPLSRHYRIYLNRALARYIRLYYHNDVRRRTFLRSNLITSSVITIYREQRRHLIITRRRLLTLINRARLTTISGQLVIRHRRISRLGSVLLRLRVLLMTRAVIENVCMIRTPRHTHIAVSHLLTSTMRRRAIARL